MAAIGEQFPNAEHIVDKFHVKQLVVNAMEQVRKQEQKSSEDKNTRFGSRHLFWMPARKLTPELVYEIAALSKRFPQTGRASRIVAGLDAFYESRSMEEAGHSFKALCSG